MSLLTDILRRPSPRTQMESSITGVSVLMIGSLMLTIYLIASNTVTGFWYLLAIILTEIGLLSFQFSILSSTYQNYRAYKLEMGLYPKDYVLTEKIKEAKNTINELNTIIKSVDVENETI